MRGGECLTGQHGGCPFITRGPHGCEVFLPPGAAPASRLVDRQAEEEGKPGPWEQITRLLSLKLSALVLCLP